MKYFFLIIILILGTFPGRGLASAYKDPSVLIVTDMVELEPQLVPYRFSNIVVEEFGMLIIDPGVTVELWPGGRIEVKGFLVATGTPELPIKITGHSDLKWQGFVMDKQAVPASMSYVEFSNFIDPITFNNWQSWLGHITIRDGTTNSIYFHQEGDGYGGVILEDIQFFIDSEKVGTEESVRFKGIFGPLIFSGITFSDSHQFYLVNWKKMGIFLDGEYPVLIQEKPTVFPFQCEKLTQTNEAKTYLRIIPHSTSCVPQDVIPTIFVPGYGTSLNLSQLTKPITAPANLTGWTFSSFLNPAYGQMLDVLRSDSIPVEIAFYDWRLPAEVSAKEYLEPLIEKTKKKYHTSTVNIVAHSFGGLVTRSYIQSEDYKGDVSQLVELGTPNLGAVKAYGAWMGGELPPDWAPLYHLLRFYDFWFARNYSPVQGVRNFFPSARDMLPIYPAIYHKGEYIPPRQLYFPNQTLLALKNSLPELFQRTKVTAVLSESEPTFRALKVGPSLPGDEWSDGKPLITQFNLKKEGDGTVPYESAFLQGADIKEVNGLHNDLPAAAADKVMEILYPWEKSQMLHEQPKPSGISFLFDCPIDVAIQTPQGENISSNNPPNNTGEGEVFNSDNLLWMIAPKQEGSYKITITAREDSLVRWWVERGEISQREFKKGEQFSFLYPPGPKPPATQSSGQTSFTSQLTLMSFPSLTVPKIMDPSKHLQAYIKRKSYDRKSEDPEPHYYGLEIGTLAVLLVYTWWMLRVVLRMWMWEN